MNKKIVLVFGATGETGLYTVDYLLNNLDPNVYEVVASGRRSTDFFSKKGIKYYSCDIENKESFVDLPKDNVYSIVHLASILPARMEGYHPEKYIDSIVKGTLNVLEYAKQVRADRILYTKSISDYHGYLKDGLNYFPPDMPSKFDYCSDHTVYAICKNAACELIEHYHEMYGLKGFIFRLPNIYLYSPLKTYYENGKMKFISCRYIIDRAIKGEPIEIWGDYNKGNDLVYVKDLTQIFYKAIISDCDGGVFNVGSGRITTLLENFQTIIDVFSPVNHKSKLIFRPEMPDTVNFWMDIDKTKKVLGYEPKYNCRAYLEDYKKEMELNRFKDLY